MEVAEAQIYRSSVQEDLSAVARWLLDNLGQRVASVGIGLGDSTMIRRYAGGTARPRGTREERMRLLYRVGRMVAELYTASTARAFLVGSNPQLGDRAPLLVIADELPEVAGPEVLSATRAFLYG